MTNAEYIWNWLWERIGNDYGTAGLMGNLCAESGLNPKNLQNSYESLLGMNDEEYTNAVDEGRYSEDRFVNDQAGYGLAQWTHPDRKRALFKFAVSFGRGISNLNMQLEFLWKEISTYKTVINTLFSAKSIREASDAVMLYYEVPADLSENNKETRAEYGRMYYDRYASGGFRKNEKAQKVIELAKEKLGCEYVFGATGQTKNGKLIFDCRGFTYWLLKQVGINISSVGATTQYNTTKDWVERGLTKDIPNLVCPVFKYNKSENKMSHTGMHIGDGVIIHCTTNGGVKYGSLSDKSWTNYAIPKGMYSDEEIERARNREAMRTLKSGCSGEDVKDIQEKLNKLGYKCGEADGIFGSKTKLAVMAFQGAAGLKADGVVGDLTRAAIEKEFGYSTGDETDEEKKDTVYKDTIGIPRKLAVELFNHIAPQLDDWGMDCRSETITQIDFK